MNKYEIARKNALESCYLNERLNAKWDQMTNDDTSAYALESDI